MRPDTADQLRLRAIERVLRLSADELRRVEQLLAPPPAEAAPPPLETRPTRFDWPHAPLHRVSEQGTFIVTGGTYEKAHHFRGPDRLDALQAALLALTHEHGWQLEAWAVFSNHYHFVAHAAPGSLELKELMRRLHGRMSGYVNELDGALGRQVWHNYWETALTFEASYLARLSYVHNNPVKHRLVSAARLYRWCSAGWFEQTATPAQVQVLSRIKTDRVKVRDDYDPE